MSSSAGGSHSEMTASREDFELFRRLMRVARLMELQENTGNANQESCLSTTTPHPNLNESNYNYDDEDDEDDGDYDGNDYESGSTRQDHLFEPGLLGPSVNLNVPDTPSSLRNMPNSQPGKVETPTQRQAQRQQRKRQKRTQQDTPGQRRHAAVEKRYRSVINSKIQQLNDLVPPSTAEPRPASGKAPTKAVVMDRALRHIDTLVSTYGEYEKERNELRQKLETWLDDFDTIGADKTMDT